MQKHNGLINKINRAFLLQAALISIAALLSVFFASIVLEEILIKQAIKQEAEYYWQNYDQDKAFPLPNTLNLTGYFNDEDLPQVVQDRLPAVPGFYEYEDDELVLYITQQQGITVYLLYNRGQVDTLAAYYGLFPLALVLIVLYLSLWITYRFSKQTISPVSWLARQLDKVDIAARDLSALKLDNFPYDMDDDIRVLSDAIVNLGKRLDAFITREQNFTRDASHELRSPLTVMTIAVDMLSADETLSDSANHTLVRIRRAIADMGELTEAFLLLARESDQALATELVSINDVIADEIDRAQLLNSKQLNINLSPQYTLKVPASEKVLAILFGNLIRNALLYTDQGGVEISIRQSSVVIKDSGKGIPQKNVDDIFKPYYRGDHSVANGHGVGMTIVKRLSDRFHWPISIDSKPGVGTVIEVRFPESISSLIKQGDDIDS
ncbi:MAG: HAMP domain-containing sensor histidine kinase [Gammaproteobacteria bacterium]